MSRSDTPRPGVPRSVRRLQLLEDRADIITRVRGFFSDAGFVEVETPILATSPGLELHLDAFPCSTRSASVDGDDTRYLITSPEYHMKRLLAEGFDAIFQMTKCFRQGERGRLHNPEFTMLEWYRRRADYRALLDDTAALVEHLVTARSGSSLIRTKGGDVDVTPPWPTMTFHDVVAVHGGIDMHPGWWEEARHHPLARGIDDPDVFLDLLFVDVIEPRLGTERPLFVTHYPASKASLARLSDDDPSVAERFELYISGVEYCNGFSELLDAREQRERFQADIERRRCRGLPIYPVDERFLTALERGVPPSAGAALGMDRLVMLLLDVDDIAEVLTFPFEEA